MAQHTVRAALPAHFLLLAGVLLAGGTTVQRVAGATFNEVADEYEYIGRAPPDTGASCVPALGFMAKPYLHTLKSNARFIGLGSAARWQDGASESFEPVQGRSSCFGRCGLPVSCVLHNEQACRKLKWTDCHELGYTVPILA